MSTRYPFPKYTVSTINPTTRGICTPTEPDNYCYFIELVMCYPKGVDTCETDWDYGNLGSNNDGKYNYGNNNRGTYNHGRLQWSAIFL